MNIQDFTTDQLHRIYRRLSMRTSARDWHTLFACNEGLYKALRGIHNVLLSRGERVINGRFA